MTESSASSLCKSCGLCCTGHLFVWVRLNANELKPCQSLGLNVIRNDPRQRGFAQPCPLWRGLCAVYTSPHYPRSCRSYQCKLLKEVLDKNTALIEALSIVQQAKKMIAELESLLPASSNNNFRERLAAHIEKSGGADFMLKADELLAFYEKYFGVNDVFDKPVAGDNLN